MRKLKKLGLIFLATLLVILPVVSGLTMLAEPMLAAETETVDSSESLGNKTVLPTEQIQTTEESTVSSADLEQSTNTSEQPIIEEGTDQSDVEEEPIVDESTFEEQLGTDSQSLTDADVDNENNKQGEPDSLRDTNNAFRSYIESESNGAQNVFLRNEVSSDKVEVNWKILKNDGYELDIQLNNYLPEATVNSRQIEVFIPRGVLVKRAHLENIVSGNSNIRSVEVRDMDSTVTDQVNLNFIRSAFFNPTSGTNTYSKDYVTGGTVIFNVSSSASTLEFKINLLPNFEEGTNNNRNFWTGVTDGSLTRGQPLTAKLIENATTVETLIMDDFKIPSTTSLSVVTRGPSTGTTTPGPQTLDEDLQLIMQPRLRNDSENSSSNAYYMSNVTFQAYLPYMPLDNGQYLSATLLTDKMDAWVNGTAASNNGNPLIQYSTELQTDGRVIITYSFVDISKEYLLYIHDLQLYYRLPSQPNAEGNFFSLGKDLYYTQNNLGWKFHNYKYSESENYEMVETKNVPLTDPPSNQKPLEITSGEAFSFAFLKRGNYEAISVEGTPATTLLGYAQITNKSSASGAVRASYQFDTENKWNYGVTTVQFWTVDSNYGGSLAASRNYEYNFDFTLQKRDPQGTGDTLHGTYKLIPSQQYQGVTISHDYGTDSPLLGYRNERYYYYVNREMLANGTFTGGLPEGFNYKDYYIKELAYNFEISSKEGDDYISGDGGRMKESGGQFYGYTFGGTNSKGKVKYELSSAGSTPGVTLSGENTTTIINKSKSDQDVGLFLSNTTQKRMRVLDENNVPLTQSTQRVDVGKKVTVTASAVASFYPYGATNYAPNPVFLIRTPVDLDLDVSSIHMAQDGTSLTVVTDEPVELPDGSKLYYAKPTDSDGLGYYNEDREMVGRTIDISYQMTVNIRARTEPIRYNELLFITDQKYAAFPSGSYAGYAVNDIWGIASTLGTEKAGFYFIGGIAKLATTNSGYMFNTNPPKLDFGLESEESGLSPNVREELNLKYDGVLDKEAVEFESTFTYENTKQPGQIDSDGKLIFYLPIAKEGLKPEWALDQETPEFSLSLTKELDLDPEWGTYEVGYSTDRDKRFDNRLANFVGSGNYANYMPYEQIVDTNSLDNVTMIKIVAKPKEGIIIPYGEKVTATMSLKYSSSNANDFYNRTGEKTYWTPFVLQVYTMNGTKNEFENNAPQQTVRIRYRPEFDPIPIWAYNETDYPTGEADGMNKEATVSLPSFINKFNLQIKSVEPVGVDLVTSDTIGTNLDRPVEYGNRTFGFLHGLNENAQVQLSSSPILELGGTLVKEQNQLSYQIFNTNNINKTASTKQVKIVYVSKGSDDIGFEVILEIKRRASSIKAETALMAGKSYLSFTEDGNNDTTLEDGAFTLQTNLEDNLLLTNWPEDDSKKEEVYLEFNSTSGTTPQNGLPLGDTILMKVQPANDIKEPEYYYYRKESQVGSDPETKIELVDFKKMGDSGESSLSWEDLTRHITNKASYLFIFDFANEEAQTTTTDTISLKFGFFEEYDAAPQSFVIETKRVITNDLENLNTVPYEMHDPIELNGKFGLTDVGTAVDSYNIEKYLALNLKLFKAGEGEISWPQGVLIQDIINSNTIIKPKLVDGDLQFVYPSSEITNVLRELEYKLKIFTDTQPFKPGNYTIKVNALKDYSDTHPLGGQTIGEADISFTVREPTSRGLRVQSAATDRLVYNKTSSQEATIDLKVEGIGQVIPVLEKKVLNNYVEVTWSDIIETPQPDSDNPVSTNPFVIKFKELDPTMLQTQNGEYRIVFKAYENADDTEPLYEVPWTFLIWDPPS
ncbi:hypothetical protein JZO70_03805 [Enterococcus sp. 669A]|uniref:Uncharacterized protein n=1 Tax=Candidatus Enterococcus moelleringii TaxID=2815325 RepID=A0ABS3L6N5_9ENTE|nr:hypothetical protein [Enterococcus sp. 669A]MBO1305272.1 hypothetical protein [Enterococcus sp. 669A]